MIKLLITNFIWQTNTIFRFETPFCNFQLQIVPNNSTVIYEMQPIDLYVDIPRNETVLKTFYFTAQTDPFPTTLSGLNPNFLFVKLSLNSGFLGEPEKNMLLFKALSFKDRPMLDYLTKIRPNINQSLSRESNLITRACSIPLPDVVRTLTEKFQADLNLPNNLKKTV